MNAALVGWGLAVVAVVVGWRVYGGPGVLLALSMIVFWLLLQFSRAVRAMRDATGRPIGAVDNAVMLHARLHAGMRLVDMIKLTRSLGRKLADEPETYVWADAGGDAVHVELQGGRLARWRLERGA